MSPFVSFVISYNHCLSKMKKRRKEGWWYFFSELYVHHWLKTYIIVVESHIHVSILSAYHLSFTIYMWGLSNTMTTPRGFLNNIFASNVHNFSDLSTDSLCLCLLVPLDGMWKDHHCLIGIIKAHRIELILMCIGRWTWSATWMWWTSQECIAVNLCV